MATVAIVINGHGLGIDVLLQLTQEELVSTV